MLRGTSGEYFISFFTIFTDTEKKPEDFNDNEILSTIVHEYIHFIQDISTVFGMSCITRILSKISHLYNSNNDNITLPAQIDEKEIDYHLNNQIFEFTFNRSEYITIPICDWDIEIISDNTSEYLSDNYEFDYYTVILKSKLGNQKAYFGAHAILEGMARIIENHLFNYKKTKYQLPYDLPLIIANSKYNIISNNPSFLAALCDASLMYYQPANVFMLSLEIMKKVQFLPMTTDDVYNFIYNNIEIRDNNFYDVWEKTLNSAKETINNIINFNHYNFPRDWALKFINESYQNRKKNPSFLTSLLMDSPDIAQQKMYDYLRNQISPIIVTRTKKFGLITSKDVKAENKEKMFYWYYLYLFYDYIFYSQSDYSCPYKKLCKIMANNCQNVPLSKIWTNQMCKFQEFIRMFNLKDKEITQSMNN